MDEDAKEDVDELDEGLIVLINAGKVGFFLPGELSRGNNSILLGESLQFEKRYVDLFLLGLSM